MNSAQSFQQKFQLLKKHYIVAELLIIPKKPWGEKIQNRLLIKNDKIECQNTTKKHFLKREPGLIKKHTLKV